MNHCVPDFEDDYALPTSSNLTRPKKPLMPEDEIMELLWQNGQVVMQSQNHHRSLKKSSSPSRLVDADQSAPRDIRPSCQQHQQQLLQQQSLTDHLFMQEDEMASWLHYPLNDSNFDPDFCADLLYPSVTSAVSTSPLRSAEQRQLQAPASVSAVAPASAARPPIPPTRRIELSTSRTPNFAHFASHKPRGGGDQTGPSNFKTVVRESTVVDSSETPDIVPESRASQAIPSLSPAKNQNNIKEVCAPMSAAAVASTQSAGLSVGACGSSAENLTTCEVTVTSSPGGSSGSAEPTARRAAEEDRKRKGREADDAECHSEDVDFESADAKKPTRGSSSAKRSRAAEVHNLSERRRRDRINEKMRALQELIPRCNKSDKASMLDEAIEYLKSLQLQVQMMSMGCGMVPMMFPGVQQYMPPMGMGIGMGIGMELGMNRPMLPFPNVLAGSGLPTAASAVHLGSRFPMPAFHMPPPVPASEPPRVQPVTQSDTTLNSLGAQTQNQPRFPNFADPYQQYIGLHQMQIPPSQNKAPTQPSSGKLSTGRGPENSGNQPPGT